MTDIPRKLPEGLEAYARSPEFTPENLPASLQAAHATKSGTWGLLHVLEGEILYQLEAPYQGEASVAAGQTVVIEPACPHHVRFVRPGRMFVEFFRQPRCEG